MTTKSAAAPYNLRSLAAITLLDVLEQGVSLSSALTKQANKASDKDKALLQELCFGTLRVLPELEFYLQALMDKVMTGKNRGIHYLLMVGLYQIIYTRIPEHAAVGETVNGVLAFKKPQLKGLINAILRNFIRQQDSLRQDFQSRGNTSLHPTWLVKRIEQAYPKNWQTILEANNQKPPMWLRVNPIHYTAEQYQQKLNDIGIESEIDSTSPQALKLITPAPVSKLPEFEQGVVTVQDLSAQQSAYLLAPQEGEVILDMCAAPGGKTTHILEVAPKANVLAVDIDPERVKRIKENLHRLNLHAEVIIGDGLTPERWCKDTKFDRILLDAPCSATGVIRRHPDIKWLRRNTDIAELAKIQYQILTRIWPYLKTGGTLLYATCSILPEENHEQINRFLAEEKSAQLVGEMLQILPTPQAGDGFFYAKLVKI